MLNVDRVVLHVDLDCFYAAVEHVRLKIPRSVPLAVQQWESLIAVNYAARSYGVVRNERAAEAKRKCPELKLVHVETIGCAMGESLSSGKVSLERYRQASARVFRVFARFASVCERAGLDEAYLDITSQVEKMVRHPRDWNAEYERLLHDPLQPYEPTVECPGGAMAVLDGPLLLANAYDQRLLAGAVAARGLQAAVVAEAGYTVSVGVACNKLLAKVASAMNKPSRITVVPPRAVPGLLQSLPLKKIRNLGRKLGEELKQMGCITAGDVQAVALSALTARFGEKFGLYVWRAVRGWHDESVQEKGIPKSMLAAKSFSETAEKSVLSRWLSILSLELAARMLRDARHNSRHPRTLHLYYRTPSASHRSKSAPMPSQVMRLLSQEALSARLQGGGVSSDTAGKSGKEGRQSSDRRLSSGCSNPSRGHRHVMEMGDAAEQLPDFDDEVLESGDDDEGGTNVVEFMKDMEHSRASFGDDVGEGGEVEGVQGISAGSVGPEGEALAEVLAAAGMRLLEKGEGGPLRCSRLALAAGDFVDLRTPGMQSIDTFFSAGQAIPQFAPLEKPSKPHMNTIDKFLQPFKEPPPPPAQGEPISKEISGGQGAQSLKGRHQTPSLGNEGFPHEVAGEEGARSEEREVWTVSTETQKSVSPSLGRPSNHRLGSTQEAPPSATPTPKDINPLGPEGEAAREGDDGRESEYRVLERELDSNFAQRDFDCCQDAGKSAHSLCARVGNEPSERGLHYRAEGSGAASMDADRGGGSDHVIAARVGCENDPLLHSGGPKWEEREESDAGGVMLEEIDVREQERILAAIASQNRVRHAGKGRGKRQAQQVKEDGQKRISSFFSRTPP